MATVLIACERSGAVRRAFRALGHNAVSCDLIQPDDSSAFHYRGDALHAIYGLGIIKQWDLIIAHPPCTYLCNSGVRWLHTRPERWADLDRACAFFLALWNAPCARVAIENPVMHKHAMERIGLGKPQFTLQPYEHGEPETKRTCFWTRGLPPITPTNIVPCTSARVHRMAPGPNRAMERSRTLPGVAAALATQWGGVL